MTRLTIRIDFDDARQIGHGKIRLLELISAHGSISRAAKEMGMSYRRAWLLADEMNRMFVKPVMESVAFATVGAFDAPGVRQMRPCGRSGMVMRTSHL